MLLTCLLKFTIQVPFAQQKSVNSLLRLSFTLPVSFFHFTNARLSLCWSENFKPVLMSCIPIYLIYGRLLIRFWKVQQNNFQTYSFNQSCTGVQHLICQRVLNICICSCICHICVSTLKLLPCVQLMYYSYLQWEGSIWMHHTHVWACLLCMLKVWAGILLGCRLLMFSLALLFSQPLSGIFNIVKAVFFCLFFLNQWLT